MATLLGNRRTYGVNSESSNLATWDFRFSSNFYLESQNIANNSSYIRIDYFMECKGGGGALTKGTNRIDGNSQTLQKDCPYGIADGKYAMGSKYFTVYHDGAGNKTLTSYGTGSYHLDYQEEKSNAYVFSYGLPSIPRAPSFNSRNVDNVTCNSAHVYAEVNTQGLGINTGGWDISTNVGATWNYYSDNGLNYTLTDLIPDTTYWYRGYVVTSGGSAHSSWGSFKTLHTAKITDSTLSYDADDETWDFNWAKQIGDEVTFQVVAESTADDGTSIETIVVEKRITDLNNSKYSLIFTSDERNILYKCAKSNTLIKFKIKITTKVGDKTYTTEKTGTYVVTDSNPIFNNFSYKDSNEELVSELTGSNQIIIKGYSNLQAIINPEDKMKAIKGAKEVKYHFIVGEKQTEANYSDDKTNPLIIDMGIIKNNLFIMYAIDSRSNSTVKQISPSRYIPYTEISKGSIDDNHVVRVGNVTEATTLNIKGTFYNIDFGKKQNDVLLTYRFKKTDDTTWSNWSEPLAHEINNNEYSYSGNIWGNLGAAGFSISDSFNIQVKAKDALSEVTYDLILESGKPNIAIHKQGVAFGGIYDTEIGKTVQIHGDLYANIFPINSIYISTVNVNPSIHFGGEWERFANGRTLIGVDENDATFKSALLAAGEKQVTLQIANMPAHSHTVNWGGGHGHQAGFKEHRNGNAQGSFDYARKHWASANTTDWVTRSDGAHNHTLQNTGDGQAHNNLPPYITVYIWRRTA